MNIMNETEIVKFQVLMAVSMKMTGFCDIAPVVSEKTTDASEALITSIITLMMEGWKFT
jgi:hypothetical protein